MMLTFDNFEIFHYCFKYDFTLDAVYVIKTQFQVPSLRMKLLPLHLGPFVNNGA